MNPECAALVRDASASSADIRVMRRLAEISRDLDIPLLHSLIIAGDELRSIGYW
jgi:hypothetical protein